jgi:hypothetical protein
MKKAEQVVFGIDDDHRCAGLLDRISRLPLSELNLTRGRLNR